MEMVLEEWENLPQEEINNFEDINNFDFVLLTILEVALLIISFIFPFVYFCIKFGLEKPVYSLMTFLKLNYIGRNYWLSYKVFFSWKLELSDDYFPLPLSFLEKALNNVVKLFEIFYLLFHSVQKYLKQHETC